MPPNSAPLASPNTGAPTDKDSLVPVPAPRSEPANEHRFDIDLMRLICSCAVILGHVAGAFILAVDRQEENGPSAYWAGHIADGANQFAVPMFFAMAGWAVLMGAPPRDSARMWTRIIRNGTPLFVWTAAYLGWAWLRDDNDKPMTDLTVDALFGSVQPAYHLWFLYAYIPIIMALGFLVLIRAGQRPWGLGIALLVIATLPNILATISEFTDWRVPTVGWSFGTYSVVYAIGGAMLFALPKGLSRRGRWLVVPLMLAAMAGCIWWDTQVHYVIPNAHPFVAILTLSLLLLVSRVRIPERWRPRLTKLAAAAMGAYMVHVFFVEELVKRWVTDDYGPLTASGMLIAMVSMTIVLSYGASLLWGKLGLRRWLG
ncbi:acyltransferase [Streptomyces litchfieldiae]|uniref:Acyltransferase n=1 Tax=Streptomyces litchfieldiae TaxID=3075543 RepID=A0ABU2MTF3_9ACTN|nr:acyltransferase [Streptomyces sp. DSM 44938]MDT0344916.1 acyltransferase [Streptomyces sp. DSM 44938]